MPNVKSTFTAVDPCFCLSMPKELQEKGCRCGWCVKGLIDDKNTVVRENQALATQVKTLQEEIERLKHPQSGSEPSCYWEQDFKTHLCPKHHQPIGLCPVPPTLHSHPPIPASIHAFLTKPAEKP